MPRLAHTEHGPADGQPLVLLHGFALHGAMWHDVASTLTGAGCRLIVPDLPGHGRSAVDHAADMESMAARVLEVAPRRFALAGFSMGGYVALALARAAPDRVAGLALVDTRADADNEAARAKREKSIKTLHGSGMRAIADAMLPKLLAPATRAGRPDLVDRVRRMILDNTVDGAVAALAAMRDRQDQQRVLGELAVPGLVVVGEHDAVTPPATARAMVGRMVDAVLAVVPEAAHLVPMEAPVACGEAMVGWLRRLERTPS